ncbi:HET-domain-containing protein [Periconia macrospinosa]|uniref:HET-domain-containing protein n=1 Tax=Periconia macrospinosa TaxID=97972 RepID=A0A2V1DFX7_9PLEO|nr:HET-domain-containing protein [Periconia macrospinosa]
MESAIRESRPRQGQRETRASDLCKRCETIDLDAVFRSRQSTNKGKPLRTLGPTTYWSTRSCSFCRLLFQILPVDRRGSRDLKLRSFSSKRIPARGWQAIDVTMLAINTDTPFILKQDSSTSGIRLIEPNVRPGVIRGWLNYCQNNHSVACGVMPLSWKPAASLVSKIPSFRMIDCETRRIVKGFDTKYVALSYVWGSSTSSGFSLELPSMLPETIEDAIAITRLLGLRYLWIDRYCIDQSNPAEKKEQVDQMDLIYSRAYLTVVAAAGEDPSYGLPGVKNRRRKTQPYAMVQGQMLISALPDPVKAIQQSKWYRRGWTYQEGILSPRRLVFTDSQLYFECSGMYCCEALNLPLRSLHTKNGECFQAKYCNKINIGMFPRGLGTSAWEIVHRIEEYSRREMGKSSDILKGISGILQAFARSRKRILHCAGVPMIPAAPPPSPSSMRWSPRAGLCGGLCWGVTSPTDRREGFPSWSWTGWGDTKLGLAGPPTATTSTDPTHTSIKWEIREDQWPSLVHNENLWISIPLDSGRSMDLEAFDRLYDDVATEVPNTLNIATWTFRVRVCGLSNSVFGEQPQYEAIVVLEDKGSCMWTFSPTGRTPISPSTEYLGIPLCHTADGELRRELYVLVIQKVDNAVYERIGFGRMNGDIKTVFQHFGMVTEEDPPLVTFWSPLPKPSMEWREFTLR